ncbi:MAG: UbiA family prenyltransferase [Terrimicrobiaceae bacterium]|nr:UbiA family prenyltransferase [Terrimicrobiaceae bacterium]
MNSKGPGRWFVYQKERFPLLAHGPLILAFSLCALSYSVLLRGTDQFPPWPVIAVAFVTSLISFLHLRLADEFKDFEEDSKYRPYRAVPRGLVTLRELGVLWVVTGLLQAALAAWLDWCLLPWLFLTWLYLGLMSKEFFCKEWLKKHPFTYMWTHMFIMPLIDLYASACDWLPTEGWPPFGLFWFVIVSFLNGFILEIGRKIRAPKDEEHGVETYSVLWGRPRAVRSWWLAMGLTFLAAVGAATAIQFLVPVLILMGGLFAVAVFAGARFLTAGGSGKVFEILAGIWTLALYLILGIVPLTWRLFS